MVGAMPEDNITTVLARYREMLELAAFHLDYHYPPAPAHGCNPCRGVVELIRNTLNDYKDVRAPRTARNSCAGI